MSAGVGKTYRMLQEAHHLLKAGVNVKIGYIETHGRKETEALDRRVFQSFHEEKFFTKAKSWMNWMYRLFFCCIRKW